MKFCFFRKCTITYILIYTLLFNLSSQNPSCGFDWYLDQCKAKNEYLNSNLIQLFKTQQINDAHFEKVLSRNSIVIPVVFHIIWHNNSEYIKDEKILQQLEILNNSFTGSNIHKHNIPLEFRENVSTNGLKFCLAKKEEEQNIIGIVRRKTDIDNIGLTDNLYYNSEGGSDAWDPDEYLNIWIADTGDYITGFATLPGQTKKFKQGVVIHPNFIGFNNSSKFNLGKVAIHEIGHFFGLKHIWGDTVGCDYDDDITDTPNQKYPYYNCPVYPQNSCNSSDMFMNYMDYVDDRCMMFFTNRQMNRMLTTLMLYRPKLIAEDINNCLDEVAFDSINVNIGIQPNPLINHKFTLRLSPAKTIKQDLYVFNQLGQVVYTFKGIIFDGKSFHIPNLSNGLYYLQVGNITLKMVVI